MEIAAQLPDRLAAPLIDAANDAFIQGIHLVSVIGVIGAIGLAIFVAVFLRSVDAAVEPEDRPALEPDDAVPVGATADAIPDGAAADS
jgi:hypothetical protein